MNVTVFPTGTIAAMARRNRLQLFLAFMDWKQAALTGLPHLLFTLRMLLPALVSQAWERPLSWLFALVILAGLGWGLRQDLRKPPRWVGSWAGYTFVLALQLILERFATTPAGTFGGILWLVGYSAALVYLGRGDRMRASLAALPVAPVFIWSMALDALLASPQAAGAFLFAGLVMACATALFEGFIWDSQMFWTVILATLVGSLPVAAAGPGSQGAAGIFGSLVGYWIAVGFFSWPVWVGWFWDWVKSKLTRGV